MQLFYNLLVSLTKMSNFVIIVIGYKTFLDVAEHFIYLFDQNVRFSLYETDSPSYFICYNTVNPISVGTVLKIAYDQLESFLKFFSVQFQISSERFTAYFTTNS